MNYDSITITFLFKNAYPAFHILEGKFLQFAIFWIDKPLSQYSENCPAQYCLDFPRDIPPPISFA